VLDPAAARVLPSTPHSNLGERGAVASSVWLQPWPPDLLLSSRPRSAPRWLAGSSYWEANAEGRGFEAREVASTGMTEIELFGEIREAIEAEAGERTPLLADFVSGGRTAQIGGPPTDRVLLERRPGAM
jgi:hypothetical protein